MRSLPICFVISLGVAGASWAQESVPAVAAAPAAQETFFVQLTEYHVKEGFGPSRTAAEIVAALTDPRGKHELVETIRLSTLSGAESLVQFGKQVTVTVGTTSIRGVATRQTQYVEVGPILRVTATPRSEDKVAVELAYESSRLDSDATDDSRPDIVTTEIQTTQLVQIGKPTLIGGTTAGNSSYTLLTVTR